MPPFLLNTFIDALHSCSVSAKFVAEGEADAVCVAVAEEKGGFVMGSDSDFLILGAASSTAGGVGGYRGYIPFDMVQWIEGPTREGLGDAPGPAEGADDFIAVSARRRVAPSHRPSPFLPSPHLERPSLAILYFTPQSLRSRLRLPTSVFPLFAALVGNDRSHPTASSLFFDVNSAAGDRIDRVARVLREALFSLAKRNPPSSPRSGAETPTQSPGDQAIELVELAMKKLALRQPPNDAVRIELLNSIIDSTFQYILPSLHDCCGLYPFCGRVGDHGLCSSFKHTDGISVYKPGPAASSFAKASRQGLTPGLMSGWLHPDRIYPRPLLEDPQGPGLRMSLGLREIRALTWSIVEHGIGELQWDLENDDDSAPRTPEAGDVKTTLDNVEDVDGLDVKGLDEAVAKLTVSPLETSVPVQAEPQKREVEADAEVELEEESYKAVVEYIRQGSSIKLSAIPLRLLALPSSTHWNAAALPLQPLANRQASYLFALQSLTPAIQALPLWLQPLVANLRCTIIETSNRAHEHKPSQHWKRKEAELCLKAGVGSWGMRRRQLEDEAKGKAEAVWDGQYSAQQLVLQTRNVDLLSQLTATMVDSHLLAQALLLVPELRGAEEPAAVTLPQVLSGNDFSQPSKAKSIDAVHCSTHSAPWVFFNGHISHLVMLGEEPASKMGWRWGERETADFELCWEALREDLPEHVIKHWGSSVHAKVAAAAPASLDQASLKAKSKERKKAAKAASTGDLKAPGRGRFDLLSSIGVE